MPRTPTTCPYCGNTNHYAENQSSYTCTACSLVVQLTNFQAEAKKIESAVLNRLDDLVLQQRAERLQQLNALFAQATGLQRDRQFHEAAKLYRKLIVRSGNDPELYWRILLCHYCVEYQQDEDNSYKPFILYPDLTPCSDRAEYRYLFECANNNEQTAYYKQKLDQIEAILSRYRELRPSSQYDVFISVKQADSSGYYTPESNKAFELYHYLTGKGLKVFNSRCNPIPVGQEYEPYIIAALISSKVMIVMGSTPENMEARWVKNEWSRFQWLQHFERTPRLLFCYLVGGMDPYDIPRELNPNKQAIVDGFHSQEILDSTLRPLFPNYDRSAPQAQLPVQVQPQPPVPDETPKAKPKSGRPLLRGILLCALAVILVLVLTNLLYPPADPEITAAHQPALPTATAAATASPSPTVSASPSPSPELTPTPAPSPSASTAPTQTPVPTADPDPSAYGDYEDLGDIPGIISIGEGKKQNLFITPNRDHDPIGKIPNGTGVIIHGRVNSWYYIQWDGIDGYVIEKYLQTAKDTAVPPTGTPTVKPTVKPTAAPTKTPAKAPTATPKPSWGEWSTWSTTPVKADNTTQVESKTQYRYRSITTKDEYTDWGEWSKWSTTKATATSKKDVATRTQYRYRDTTYTTQESWSAWSDWSTSPVTASDTVEVRTQVGHPTAAYYSYSRYKYTNPIDNQIYYSYASGYAINMGYGGEWQYKNSATKLSQIGSHDGYPKYAGDWYNESYHPPKDVTEYSFRTKTVQQVPQIGSWSSWSTTKPAASSTREVETRTQYRFRTRTIKTVTTYGDWSNWADKSVKETDTREVQKRTVYRYRKLK